MTRRIVLFRAPVEVLTQDRPAPVAPVVVPEVGRRWGARATFRFGETDPGAADENGGVEIRPSGEHSVTERVIRFSPVWRRYEVYRLTAEDPAYTALVTVTREALVPVRRETLRYVGGGLGYVVDTGRYGYTERVVHTFALLTIPPPDLHDAVLEESGTVGAWPAYPEDEWATSVAALVAAPPLGGPGGGWMR